MRVLHSEHSSSPPHRSRLWSRLSLRNWLSRQKSTKKVEFQADDIDDSVDLEDSIIKLEGMLEYYVSNLETRHSCSLPSNCDEAFPDFCNPMAPGSASCQLPRHSSAMPMAYKDSQLFKSSLTEKQQIRIFVGTWNVGGRAPNDSMDIEQWLGSDEQQADLYVVGFQEVVPLNAGNVLGVENHVPAARWLHLIRHTLNSSTCCSLRRSCSTQSSFWQEAGSFTDTMDDLRPVRTAEEFLLQNRTSGPPSMSRLNNGSGHQSPEATPTSHLLPSLSISRSLANRSGHSSPRFLLLASKQMVGIFLSVWVSADLRRHVSNLKVSCIGCGLLGYLGNKGSISISLCIHQTTFCFVCSHLTSGQKDRDELRRNADVLEILKRTQFNRRSSGQSIGGIRTILPQTIMQHDRIIWLGDLNYRLSLSRSAAKTLLATEDWKALLDRDQLHIERMAGRVFVGWSEGQIHFAPTYKYRANSDCYASEKLKGEKRRTPAWCDRILWHGNGFKQLMYSVRAEARFSDHRPVYAVFSAEVEALSRKKLEELTARSLNK